MPTLFLTVLNMSIAASVVILAVVLIRGLLYLIHVPKKYSYLLWLAVAFRLVCPISFGSALSVFRMTSLKPVAIPARVTTVMDCLPASVAGSFSVPLTQTSAAANATPPEDWLILVAGVWLGGMVAMTAYGLVSWLIFRHRMSTATHLEGNVWQSENVGAPFIMGIFSPQIYLPYRLGDAQQYVLAHERYHLRRKDHIIKQLSYYLLVLHWFNPLCWLAFLLMGRDMEMSCDESVLLKNGNVRREYSLTLLSFAINKRLPITNPVTFGERSVKTRIKNILHWQQPQHWKTAGAAVLCILVLASCSLNPALPSGERLGSVAAYTDRMLKELTGTEVEYCSAAALSSGAENPNASAVITEAKAVSLTREGTLEDLSPEGTLELWRFQYLTRLDVEDPSDVSLTDGAYEEDGWFDLSGQGGDYIIALRHSDDSYEILASGGMNDADALFSYRGSSAEVLYDWYVAETDSELPPCVKDWGSNLPVHRYDGDGWYLYAPVSGWSPAGENCWQSDSGTGATLQVEKRPESLQDIKTIWTEQGVPCTGSTCAVSLQSAAGETDIAYYPASDGGCYAVISVIPAYGDSTDPNISIEPTVLNLMAESFTVLA